jgi:Flp pilus assembly protein CpaB
VTDVLRSRSTILLVVGVVLALLTGGGLYLVAASQQGVKAIDVQAAAEGVSAIVAKNDIPARTVVTAEMLTRKQLPADALPEASARNESEVIGQTTLAPIPAGSLILKPQLAAAGGKSGQSLTLEAGKVLVAFPTTDPLTSAGLVSPGDHVDLLVTITVGQGDTARKTQTTVQNLEVIQVLGPTAQAPTAPRALTFIVDHQVALFLKYLRDSQSSIELAVRSRAENDVTRTQTVNIQVLQETFGFR